MIAVDQVLWPVYFRVFTAHLLNFLKMKLPLVLSSSICSNPGASIRHTIVNQRRGGDSFAFNVLALITGVQVSDSTPAMADIGLNEHEQHEVEANKLYVVQEKCVLPMYNDNLEAWIEEVKQAMTGSIATKW